jgi:hypothetical protein
MTVARPEETGSRYAAGCRCKHCSAGEVVRLLAELEDARKRVAAAEAQATALSKTLREGCLGCRAGYPLTDKGVHPTPRGSFFLCKLSETQRAALAPSAGPLEPKR